MTINSASPDARSQRAGENLRREYWCFLLVASLLVSCAGDDLANAGSQQSSCNLIGDQKCGTNSVGKAVVLECQVVESSTESGAVKEWHIAEACEHCCVEAMCVSAGGCREADAFGYSPDAESADVLFAKPDVLKDASAKEDVATEWVDVVWYADNPDTSVGPRPVVDTVEEDEWCYYCYDIVEEDNWWEEDTTGWWDASSSDSDTPTCPADKCHPSNPCGWDCNAYCDCPGAAWDYNDCSEIDCHDPQCCQPSNPCHWEDDQQCECGGDFTWDAADCEK